MRLTYCLLFIIILASACHTKDAATVQAGSIIDSLFKEYYEFKKRINPLEATKAGFQEYNARFANFISASYQQDVLKQYSAFLDHLSKFDSTSMSPSQWLSADVMNWDCRIKIEGLKNPLVTIPSPVFDMPGFSLFPLTQTMSTNLYFSQLADGTSIQPFHTVADYDNWLKRVDGYLMFLDTAISHMRQGIASGIVLPRVLIKKMIPQVEVFANTPVKNHLFYTPVNTMPAEFPAADKARLTEAYTSMVGTRLIPKYRELLDFLVKSYLPAGRQTVGLSALPDGAATYQYLIRYHTTTNMTAAAIHELGKSEVMRILGEMEKVKTTLGFNGDLKAFFAHVRSNRQLMPYSKPEDVIEHFNDIQKRLNARLGDVFDLKPKGSLEVRRTESFREASASAEFLPGDKEGTRPGIFYVPIPSAKTYNNFMDEALFLHEAIPGHYYQLTLQQENDELPEFLHPESIGVFVEGWGLYAESLGKELGIYEDPYQYFGMLSMEMHRAIRLVVDTGIHAMGWTPEQAVEYSLQNEADSKENITVEVERYIANPGQALSYKVGQIMIRKLRTRAEQALGAKFSVKEFHNQVLNSGSLPLVLLEQKIDSWIAKTMRA